jgi:hypothetical protein
MRHGGVELQVGPYGGKHPLLLDLLHEDLQLQPEGFLVKSIRVKVDSIICWGDRGQKLGARKCVGSLRIFEM